MPSPDDPVQPQDRGPDMKPFRLLAIAALMGIPVTAHPQNGQGRGGATGVGEDGERAGAEHHSG